MKEAAFAGTVDRAGKQRILLFIISETVVSLFSTILKIATRITAACRPEATRASRVFAVFAIPSQRSASLGEASNTFARDETRNTVTPVSDNRLIIAETVHALQNPISGTLR